MSTLNRIEKIGLISKAQKRDEYLRFCNMINRILILDNLSESIKLIQFDDEERYSITESDGKTCDQVSCTYILIFISPDGNILRFSCGFQISLETN